MIGVILTIGCGFKQSKINGVEICMAICGPAVLKEYAPNYWASYVKLMERIERDRQANS